MADACAIAESRESRLSDLVLVYREMLAGLGIDYIRLIDRIETMPRCDKLCDIVDEMVALRRGGDEILEVIAGAILP